MNTIIVSDFHICSGTNPITGLTSSLEDFTDDYDFEKFLNWLAERPEAPWHLILGGDMFDFQQVNDLPTLNEIKEFGLFVYAKDLKWSAKKQIKPKKKIYHYDDLKNLQNFDNSWCFETWKTGLGTEENAMKFKMHKVMEGHSVFFKALAGFLKKGNKITFLRGNHDVELAWPSIQEMIKNYCSQESGLDENSIRQNLVFLPHYYYEEELLYIEHGQQGEAETSLRHVYSPFIKPKDKTEKVIELDFSSFLMRYLMNQVESINPLSDNYRPRSRYFNWLISEHPAQAVRVVAKALPKVLKLWKACCQNDSVR